MCIQVVAMSATMSGLDSLSDWLDAHLFLTNFRPVPLTEHAVFEGTVFAKVDRAQQRLQAAGKQEARGVGVGVGGGGGFEHSLHGCS
jgi:replicative superfamily II helicase